MDFIKYGKFALLVAACCVNANADHKADAPWSWHIVSAGLDESRISIHRRDQLLGIYNLSCDLTDISEGPRIKNGASLNLVQIDSHPEGLLLITCNLGAHSQQVAIIDLASKSNQPAFIATGSYFADWELQDGELWIRYDRPCDGGLSAECPDGYETIYVQYPNTKQD